MPTEAEAEHACTIKYEKWVEKEEEECNERLRAFKQRERAEYKHQDEIFRQKRAIAAAEQTSELDLTNRWIDEKEVELEQRIRAFNLAEHAQRLQRLEVFHRMLWDEFDDEKEGVLN